VAIVLIIGARGIGLETVNAALGAGHSVLALARSARRIPVNHPKLKKVAGDALEMATLKRALRSRCRHPIARRFGRARNHIQTDAPFRQWYANADHCDGGDSRQTVDLRDGFRGGGQPRPRRVSIYRSFSLILSRAGCHKLSPPCVGIGRIPDWNFVMPKSSIKPVTRAQYLTEWLRSRGRPWPADVGITPLICSRVIFAARGNSLVPVRRVYRGCARPVRAPPLTSSLYGPASGPEN
jgi:hypothetical protein